MAPLSTAPWPPPAASEANNTRSCEPMATRLTRRPRGVAAAAWREGKACQRRHHHPLALALALLLLGATLSGPLGGAAAVRVPNPLAGRPVRPPAIAARITNAASSNAASRQLLAAAQAPSSGIGPGTALGDAPAPGTALLMSIQAAENSTTPSGNTTATDASSTASTATSALLRAALIAVLVLGSVAICGALLPLYIFPCPDPFKLFFLPLVFGMGTPHNGATTVVVTGA